MASGSSSRIPPRRVLKTLYEEFNGKCAIPDCTYPSRLPDETPILQIAHISAAYPGSPRFDPRVTNPNRLSNLILLCPNHHLIVDSSPEKYTLERLRKIRRARLGERRTENAVANRHPSDLAAKATRLENVIKIWNEERQNSSEEYWQKLFAEHPEILVAATQGRAYTLNSKCYVGGKAVTNRGGGVLDFLVQHSTDVVLIEIKTPMTRLIGGQYRDGVYSPSPELGGAITQALNYRRSLLAELYTLQAHSPGLTVCSPSIFIIIGDVERESFSEVEQRSFQLFRTAFKDVVIHTYDELFAGLASLAALWESEV